MRMLIDGRAVPTSMIQSMMADIQRQNPKMSRQEAARLATEETINNILLRNAAFREFPDISSEMVDQEFQRLRTQVGGDAGIKKICTQNNITTERIREDLSGSLRVRLLVEKILAGVPEKERDQKMNDWLQQEKKRTPVSIQK